MAPEKLLSRLRLLRPPSLPLAAPPPPPSPASPQRHCRRCQGYVQTHIRHHSTANPSAPPRPQKIPLGEYYESILRNALHADVHARQAEPPRTTSRRSLDAPLELDVPLSDPRAADEKTRTPLDTTTSFDTSPPAPPPAASIEAAPEEVLLLEKEEMERVEGEQDQPQHVEQEGEEKKEDKIRIIFGSRLLGPAEQADRAAAKREQSTLVAGVLVPPRPEEPDNCCMSGCVNCVWDRYGEDLEEWTAKRSEAETLLKAMGGIPSVDAGVEVDVAGERGMGKVTTKEMLEEEAFSVVPMGIREFIKMERRLREKHGHEQEKEHDGAVYR